MFNMQIGTMHSIVCQLIARVPPTGRIFLQDLNT